MMKRAVLPRADPTLFGRHTFAEYNFNLTQLHLLSLGNRSWAIFYESKIEHTSISTETTYIDILELTILSNVQVCLRMLAD